MTDESLYTIGQLAELVGVTPRTIRYYTAEGLLPRPDARGQYALYSPEHMLRLQLIARLKDAYLPLGEIKSRIERLGIEQIRELLANELATPEPLATNAAEYVSNVLARQQPPAPSEQRIAEAGELYAVPTRPAFSVQQRVAPDQPGPLPAAASTYGFAAPAAPAPAPAEAGPPPGLLRKLIPQRRARAERDRADAAPESGAPPHESWRRIPLAPGIELHVRQPIAAQLQERVDALITLARNLFGGD